MRPVSFAVAFAFACAPALAHADEGMWTFDNFPADKMTAQYGWSPDKAWLDHVRLSSIRLAQGCSASLVSPNGLVMTNHHCARGCIGALSDAKHDYVAHGFTAALATDEKRCPEIEANQLTEISDVTKTIQDATAGKSGQEFNEAERAAIAIVQKSCGTASDIRCQVVTLYNGGKYDLYKYKRYQDVRLVWAVEDSGANFGGDPDNFNFPRYAIDAAFVRIYDQGKPLASPNFLRFSKDGVKEGDVTFTSGNPGNTERQDTAAQLRFVRDQQQPFLLNLFSEMRGVLAELGTKGPEQLRFSLTDLFFTENSLKAVKGRQLALVEGAIIPDTAKADAALHDRIAADPNLSGTAGAWDAIAAATEHRKTLYQRYALLESLPPYVAGNTIHAAIALNRFAAESGKPDPQRLPDYQDSTAPTLKQVITADNPVYPELDRTMIAWWLTKVREDLGADDPDVHAILGRQSPEQIAAQIVDGTKLKGVQARAALLAGGASAINASNDPMLVFVRRLDGPARAVRSDYENNVKAIVTQNATAIARAKFALDGTKDYPDATFSLRLSYGTVKSYEQAGKTIPPFTDFAGAFARATGSAPFVLPPSWVKAASAMNQATHLDMATTNDIIGGNSGSPVVDRKGEAVGLIFDGNIQSLGGDFGYDGAQNRALAVDVTGIREGLAHIYHADRLVKELAQ
jgi:V8-like Glu-specific endopeptidase